MVWTRHETLLHGATWAVVANDVEKLPMPLASSTRAFRYVDLESLRYWSHHNEMTGRWASYIWNLKSDCFKYRMESFLEPLKVLVWPVPTQVDRYCRNPGPRGAKMGKHKERKLFVAGVVLMFLQGVVGTSCAWQPQ